MLKQILRSARADRDFQGILFDCFIVKASEPEVLKTSEENSNYNKLVEKEGKGHKRGPPYIATMSGLIAALVARGDAVGLANKQQLEGFKTQWESWDMATATYHIRLCRVDKVFDSNLRRVTLSFMNPDYRLLVVKCMENLGFERKR